MLKRQTGHGVKQSNLKLSDSRGSLSLHIPLVRHKFISTAPGPSPGSTQLAMQITQSSNKLPTTNIDVSTSFSEVEYSQENKRATQFMDLPLEIRWMIYACAGMNINFIRLTKFFRNAPKTPPPNSFKARITSALLLPDSITKHIYHRCECHSAPFSKCLDDSIFSTIRSKPLRVLIQFRPTFLQVCRESRDEVCKEFHFRDKGQSGLRTPKLISNWGTLVSPQNQWAASLSFTRHVTQSHFSTFKSRRLAMDVELWDTLWKEGLSSMILNYFASVEHLELIFPPSLRKEVVKVCKGDFDPKGTPLWFRCLEMLHDALNIIMRDHAYCRYPTVELRVSEKKRRKVEGRSLMGWVEWPI